MSKYYTGNLFFPTFQFTARYLPAQRPEFVNVSLPVEDLGKWCGLATSLSGYGMRRAKKYGRLIMSNADVGQNLGYHSKRQYQSARSSPWGAYNMFFGSRLVSRDLFFIHFCSRTVLETLAYFFIGDDNSVSVSEFANGAQANGASAAAASVGIESVSQQGEEAEEYQPITAKEEQDFRRLLGKCQMTIGEAEKFAEHLNRELSTLDGVSWVGILGMRRWVGMPVIRCGCESFFIDQVDRWILQEQEGKM